MKNITLAIDEKILKAGREYAKKHNTTLSALVSCLLKQTIQDDSQNWVDECFRLMDEAKVMSKRPAWTRKELYRL